MTLFSTGDNNFGQPGKWYVHPTAGLGTHTTIAAALASASSGDTIYLAPFTFAESPTININVQICSIGSYESISAAQAKIGGTVTISSGGSSSVFSNVQFVNTSTLITYSSAGGGCVFNNCTFSANGSLIFNNSGTGTSWFFNNCVFAGTGAYQLFSISGTAIFNFTNCYTAVVTGGPATPSTISGGSVNFDFCSMNTYITSSGNSSVTIQNCNISTITTIPLIIGGTGTNVLTNSYIASGTAAAVSVGTGATLTISNLTINSTNTNPITGAGTVDINIVEFTNTGTGINTTTIVNNANYIGSLTLGSPLATTSGGTGASNSAATTGTILRSNGTGFVPTTATYPNSTTINQILYSSASNTIGGLATANSAILNTTSGGVPSLATSPSVSGTITAGTGLTATTGNITATSGNLLLPTTTSSVGQVQINTTYFMHAFNGNTFLGLQCGNFTTTASTNVGIGQFTHSRTSSGGANVGIGYNCQSGGSTNLTGSNNIGIGYSSQQNMTSGTSNIAIGFNSQQSGTLTGSSNISIGNSSGSIMTSANFNIGIGDNTLNSILTGTENVVIGYNSGTGYTTGSETNNIILGYSIAGTNGESNVIRIGNTSNTKCFITGIVGNTSSNTDTVTINSSTGQLGVLAGTPGVVGATTVFGTSAAPTGTASTAAYVMLGLGSSWKLTPSVYTSARVTINGQLANGTTGDGINVIISFGTGSAPINGAAVTGTAVGINTIFTDLTGLTTNGAPFSKHAIITGLTPGTAYWFDLQFKAVTGGTASVLNIEFSAQELQY